MPSKLDECVKNVITELTQYIGVSAGTTAARMIGQHVVQSSAAYMNMVSSVDALRVF